MKRAWPLAFFANILGLLFIASACSSLAPPPSQAPAAPPKGVESVKLKATAMPTTKPAATAPAKSEAAAKTDSWTEWDKTVAAAKQEGKLVVFGGSGDNWRKATLAFQQAYPEITLQYTGGQAERDFVPKVMAERRGGLYLWDVFVGGSGAAFTNLIPNKVLAPLPPALVRPEVQDDGNWLGGFQDGYLDNQHQYIYQFQGYLMFSVDVNRDLAPEAELKTVDDLLAPKWKGKIAWQDPRRGGSGQRAAQNFLQVKGEDWLRELLAQDIEVMGDSRQMYEGLVRGRYAAVIGATSPDRLSFKDAGVAAHIETLERNNTNGGYVTGGTGHLGIIDDAPNPNAAKAFINWLLSKEGQKTYVEFTGVNSRRLDTEGPAESEPVPGVKYPRIGAEENLPAYERAAQIAVEMFR